MDEFEFPDEIEAKQKAKAVVEDDKFEGTAIASR